MTEGKQDKLFRSEELEKAFSPEGFIPGPSLYAQLNHRVECLEVRVEKLAKVVDTVARLRLQVDGVISRLSLDIEGIKGTISTMCGLYSSTVADLQRYIPVPKNNWLTKKLFHHLGCNYPPPKISSIDDVRDKNPIT